MVSKKDYSGCAAISLYPVQKDPARPMLGTKNQNMFTIFLKSNLSLVSTQILRTKKTTLLQCPYKSSLFKTLGIGVVTLCAISCFPCNFFTVQHNEEYALSAGATINTLYVAYRKLCSYAERLGRHLIALVSAFRVQKKFESTRRQNKRKPLEPYNYIPPCEVTTNSETAT